MVAKKLGEIIQLEHFQKHSINTKGGLRFYHRIVYKPKGYGRPRLAKTMQISCALIPQSALEYFLGFHPYIERIPVKEYIHQVNIL